MLFVYKYNKDPVTKILFLKKIFNMTAPMDAKKLLEIAQNIRNVNALEIPKLADDLRNTYKALKEDPDSLGNALYKISFNIVNMTDIKYQYLPYYQQILDDIILCSIENQYRVGYEAIRNIFNINAEFYKNADLDIGMKYPIGRDRPLKSYRPVVGEECDVVRPYITSASYCGWVRCKVLEVDGNKYTFQYINTTAPVIVRQQPFFAPLGTRTLDYDWRMNLNIGSPIEAHSKRMWIQSTIVEKVIQNDFIQVRVSFRRFAENGDRQDSDGNRYFGFGPNEDQWLDIFSPRIQQNGKMVNKKLCYITATSDELILDDNYDMIFQKQYEEKPFHGILRTIFLKSLSYLRFMNTFTKNRGFETLFEIMNRPEFDYNPIFYLLSAIGFFVNFIPRMDINRYLPELYNYSLNFFKGSVKVVTPQKIDYAYFCIDAVGKRLFSLTEVFNHQNEIRKVFITAFLKENMQKQMLALKYLYDLISPKQPYSEQQRQQANHFIIKEKLFYQIFQIQTHEQILTRTPSLLKYLLEVKIVQAAEIEYIWNLAPYSDQRTRAIIQKILAEISKFLPIEYIQNLLDKLLQLKETELTFDNLNLLRQLKNREITPEYQLRILTYLWDIITTKSYNIKTNIEEEVQKVFKVFVSGLKSPQIRVNVLGSMVSRLTETKKVQSEVDLLRDFIGSYPEKKAQNVDPTDAPLTIYEAINYLKTHNIYDKLLQLILNSKKDMVVMELLKFLGYLFEYDTEDASSIIKEIYDKFGPSDILLEWIQKNLKKAQNFVTEMLESYDKIDGFADLSSCGFGALTEIIVAVNQIAKKIKIMTTYKYESADNKNVGTQTLETKPENQKMIGPVLPGKVKHLYILVSPFQLIGMKFLSNLLHVLKNSKVYDQAVKLIIKFIVSLDESLADRTLQFRQEFLGEIIKQMAKIYEQNQLNEDIKKKILVYINLFIEIFRETEKNGLGDVSPHFEQLIGEKFTFDVENTCPQHKQNRIDKFVLIMNQNDTFWKLKQKIGEIIKENPMDLDIIRFATPLEDTCMGKSLKDISFHDGEGIKVAKKPVKQIPKHNLLNEDGTDLSQRFNEIVVGWFEHYKNKDNNISFEELKKLAEQKWRGSLLRQPDKLQKIMQEHDKQSKGYLTFENFKDFYHKKSVKNQNAIWKLIHLSGYRNNLRQAPPKQEVKQFNSNTLPRRILSSPLVYELIFKFFRNPLFEPIQMDLYRLLSMLEVNTQTQKNIDDHIYKIIDESDSVYEFSYAIQIANSSISRVDNFFFDFWKNRGAEKVLRRIVKVMENTENIYKLEVQIKDTILPNLLKNINFYMKYLFSDRPINRFLSTLKLNFTETDDLMKKHENWKESDEEIKNTLQVKEKLQSLYNGHQYEEFQKTAQCILQNLIKNFTSESTDFLPKLTVEVVRLIGYISLGKPELFCPAQFISGSKSQSLNYRRTTANLIYLYIREHPENTDKLLIKMLEQMPNQAKHIYGNYFSFLSKVVEFYLSKHMDSPQKDGFFIDLANNLLDRLFQNIEGEPRAAIIGDKVISGILSTVLVLLKKQSIGHALKDRKHEITEKCLFAYGIQQKIQKLQVTEEMLTENKQALHFKNYVKCKTEETRKFAYDIVSVLHKLTAKEDSDFIEKYIFPIFQIFSGEVRLTDSKTLSIGLKNFGSTCYMNSMLQVLNAVGPFRNMLLQANSSSELVKQLKNTFSALFFSQRVDYAPRKLLEAFVPPINPGIQQDTTEFLNFLFDQLESGLSKTGYKKLLDQIFKGTTTAQMICSNCGFKKQNREQFFSHSIEIEGRYNLAQALEHSYDGQIISDYKCDSCQQKCDMKKRNLIGQVPNIFFIHLRRIVFNYDMFINMKIHTRLEFPNELNIEPYTKQGVQLRESLGLQYLKNLTHNEEQMKKFQEMTLHGKQKDFYKLKLKGVIVHSGSADVGHYYSILSTKNKTWFKYDDSRVSIFTQYGFQKECYGGMWQNQQWGGFGTSTNAYFLVYEKVVKKPIKIFRMPESESELEAIEEEISIEYDQQKIYNTVEQYKSVWLDNHKFMMETHLLQESYAKGFMKFLNELLMQDVSSNKVALISQILYKFVIHSEEIGQLYQIFSKCQNDITYEIFTRYVIADKKKTFKLLFSHNRDLRHFMGIYLSKVCFNVLTNSQNEQTRKEVYNFIGEYLHNMTGDIAKNWLRIDGFFIFIDSLVIMSEKSQQLWDFFMSYHLISLFIDFVMEKSSPVRINPKNYSLGTKTNPLDFSVPLKTISFLIKHSYGLNGQNYEIPSIPASRLFHLNDNDIICLCYGEFYRKMLKQRQNMREMGVLIQRLCIQNMPFSYMVSEIILTMIGSNTDMTDEMQDYSCIVVDILKISDQFWRNRAEMILGVSNPYVIDNNVMTTLDEERYIFSSTIYDIFPVECLFAYVYLYRLKNTLACFYLTKAILEGCSVTPTAMEYLVKQPSSSYYFQSYLDWIQQFILSIGGVIMVEKVRERVMNDQKLALKYVADYKEFIAKQQGIYKYRTLITGEIFNKKKIGEYQDQGIEVSIYEYEAYCLDSHPAYHTNTALDAFLDSGRLIKPLNPESTILKFMKNPKKSIALKAQQASQNEDKQLLGLFDEEFPQTNNNKMEIEKDKKQPIFEQHRENQQIAMQEESEQIRETINIPNYRTTSYFREIEIVNKSKTTKLMKFDFVQNPDQKSNMILPSCFAYKLSTKSNEKMWIGKQDYERDWTPIKFNLYVEDFIKEKHEKNPMRINWFKLYGYVMPEQQQRAPLQPEPMIDERDEKQQNNNTENEIIEISCPICTFLNFSINTTCEMCGQKLM